MPVQLPDAKPGAQTREMRSVIVMIMVLVVLIGVLVGMRRTSRQVKIVEELVPAEPAFTMEETFEPVEELDTDLIEDSIIDLEQVPRDATEIVNDYEAIFHALRYLRTLEKEGKKGYFEQPDRQEYEKLAAPTPVRQLSTAPRGKLVRVVGRIRQPCPYRVENLYHLDGAGKAGVKKVSLSIVRGIGGSGSRKHEYMVVSPMDVAPWGGGKMVQFDGVYLKAWPRELLRGSGKYRWMPMVAALKPVEVEMPKDTASFVLKLVVGAVVIVIVVIALLGRKDAKLTKARRKRETEDKGAAGGKAAKTGDEGGTGEGAEKKESAGEKEEDDLPGEAGAEEKDGSAEDKPAEPGGEEKERETGGNEDKAGA
ncbi:MAG: hypothetical protein JW909_13555 [Planctomycetes bacterium]|nr:hypothetical protein [Planctomycetota bacterium]